MKKKLSFTYYILQLPYIILILYSIYSAIIGLPCKYFESNPRYYGLDAFAFTFVIFFNFLWWIFLLFFIIQEIILIYGRNKKINIISKKMVIMSIGIYILPAIAIVFSNVLK